MMCVGEHWKRTVAGAGKGANGASLHTTDQCHSGEDGRSTGNQRANAAGPETQIPTRQEEPLLSWASLRLRYLLP